MARCPLKTNTDLSRLGYPKIVTAQKAPVHTTKVYGGSRGTAPLILNLYTVCRCLHDVGGRTPGTHCVGPRAYVDYLKEKIVPPARNRTTIPLSSGPYTDYIIQVKYHHYIIAKFPVITTNFMLQIINHVFINTCNCKQSQK